jgi:hypothetical protein
MEYEKIDPTINGWVERNRLYLYKEYKEIEVRSVEFVSANGRRFQIWVDPPDVDGMIGIHVWDFKRKRRDFLVSEIDLDEYLQSTLDIAQTWAG